MSELEFPFGKYELGAESVDAIEVTHQFVNSLPNCGATLQRFGEQVEIFHGGPSNKKTYAQIGEVVVRGKDANGKDTYFVLSGIAFKGLFAESHEESKPPENSSSNADGSDDSDGEGDDSDDTGKTPPALHTAPLQTQPPAPVKPETAQQKAHREKEEAKQKRLAELHKNDMGVKEAGEAEDK